MVYLRESTSKKEIYYIVLLPSLYFYISDGKTISFPLRLFTVIKIFKPLHEVRIVDHSLIKTKFSTVSLISRKELICGYYVLIYYDAKTEVS